MGESRKRIVVIISSGSGDGGTKATLAFSWACGALSMGREVMLMATADGTIWGLNGACEGIHTPGFEPLEKYVEQFKELGGILCVCPPCLEFYCSVDKEFVERGLRDGAETCGVARALNFAGENGQIINF